MGAPILAWRHAVRHPVRTATLVLAVALLSTLPMATAGLLEAHGERLRARARATPLLVGAAGDPLRLALAGTVFRDGASLRPVPQGALEELSEFGLAIPINLGAAARGRPVVATTPEYFEHRRLRPARGSLPLRLGEAVLGSEVADALELDVGDRILSDPDRIHDLRQPPSLALEVVGVLEHTGTADDAVVLVDLGTAWVLEGMAHGHDDAAGLDGEDVAARAGSHTLVGPTAAVHGEVSASNLGSFHTHGDPATFPLSAVLVLPRDRASATILSARLRARGELQAVSPAAEVEGLLEGVLRVRRLFEGVMGLVAMVVGALLIAYLGLSMRLRRAELALYARLGAGRGFVWRMLACEWGATLALGLGLGGLLAAVAVAWAPDMFGLWDRLG